MRLEPLNIPLDLFGTGFPNRVVSAPVGSIYTDTEATNGAIRWIKTSGTGSTGWSVEHGDTGWRDATSLYAGSRITLGEGAKILIRRVNADILFKLVGPVTANGTRANLMQLTTGWRPETDTWVALGGAGEQARHSTIWISLESMTDGRDIIRSGWSKEARWLGRDEWPSSLPGLEESPAGSGLYTDTSIVENPADSGLFDIPTNLTEDPDNPGLYLIGD